MFETRPVLHGTYPIVTSPWPWIVAGSHTLWHSKYKFFPTAYCSRGVIEIDLVQERWKFVNNWRNDNNNNHNHNNREGTPGPLPNSLPSQIRTRGFLKGSVLTKRVRKERDINWENREKERKYVYRKYWVTERQRDKKEREKIKKGRNTFMSK